MASVGLKGKRLWQGAVYLSLAAVVIKILSAAYRIPYQNIAGDVGFYVYQQIYPIYGTAIILATYGFPVIISKLVSQQQVQEEQKIVKNAFLSLFMISFFIFLCFYYFAPHLAKVMGDKQLEVPLKAVSFTFFIIPFLSVLRGVFQGKGNMLPTAISQVTEQLIRVIAILLFTYFFITNGYGPYAAGTGAAIASVIGGFVSFFVLFSYYRKEQTAINVNASNDAPLCLNTIKIIILHGVMICFSSLVLVFFQFIDSMTILRGLQEKGIAIDIAKISKGVFDRGQPLIQMGTIITTSFSLVVVPLIAKVSLERRQDLIKKYSSLSVRISYLIGAAAAIGLAIIIEPTNVMLYTDNTDSIVLAVMGTSIFFASIFLTTSAILHGLNKVHITVVHVFIGLVVKLVLNIFLIQTIGTLGAATATVIACTVCALLNILTLRKLNALSEISLTRGVKALFSVFAMASVTLLWKEGVITIFSNIEMSRIGSTIIALSSVSVGAVIFLICVIVLGIFSEEEIEHIPKVRKILAFMQSKKGI